VTDYQVNGKRSIRKVTNWIIRDGLEPWFRGYRMANIAPPDVRAYIAYRQEQGYSNATINRELAALKRMFTLAVQAGTLLARPHIELLAEDNVRTGFFERAQFESVRALLPPALQAVVTLAYYTGWRVPSELLTLEWRQIDRLAAVIRLEPGTTKNRDGRVFKYAELSEVVATIEGLWQRHEALERRGVIVPYVFCRDSGERIQSFYKRWNRACRLAGCPGRRPHDFRRTAVRNLNRAGVPETVAMKITGHKTRSVFDRYDITSEEDLSDAARKLEVLTGTISGTIGRSGAEVLKERLAKSVKGKRFVEPAIGLEPMTCRLRTICQPCRSPLHRANWARIVRDRFTRPVTVSLNGPSFAEKMHGAFFGGPQQAPLRGSPTRQELSTASARAAG
jgi:integrase